MKANHQQCVDRSFDPKHPPIRNVSNFHLGPRDDSLVSLLDQLVEHTTGDKVTLGKILDVVAHRSFGPLLLVIGLIAVGPTAAIPFLSYIAASIVIVLSAQMLIGKKYPWIPQGLAQFEFSRATLEKSVKIMRPYADRIDDFVGARLTLFTTEPARRLIAGVCTLLALCIFPLDMLPFTSGIPALAIAVFGLGLTMRDGLVIAIGFALSASAAWLVIWMGRNLLSPFL